MNDVFHLRQNTFSLQNFYVFAIDIPTNNYLLSSVVYRAIQLSEALPFDLKNSEALPFGLLQLFKNRLKYWRCTECTCQICSRFLVGAGDI